MRSVLEILLQESLSFLWFFVFVWVTIFCGTWLLEYEKKTFRFIGINDSCQYQNNLQHSLLLLLKTNSTSLNIFSFQILYSLIYLF